MTTSFHEDREGVDVDDAAEVIVVVGVHQRYLDGIAAFDFAAERFEEVIPRQVVDQELDVFSVNGDRDCKIRSMTTQSNG